MINGEEKKKNESSGVRASCQHSECASPFRTLFYFIYHLIYYIFILKLSYLFIINWLNKIF